MKLMTKKLEKRFNQVGCQNGKDEDTIVIAHFFNPYGAGDWYATEKVNDICFGYVSILGGDNDEWRYFLITELEENKIERDLYWVEKPLKEVDKYHK